MSYTYIYIEHLFFMFLDHTQRRSTVGRTPLDEWSARRRDLYLTTHDTHNRQISMPPVGFKPTISAGERPQAVSGTSRCLFSDKYKTHKYSVGRAYSCWMLNCWCITWPVGFKRLIQCLDSVTLNRPRPPPSKYLYFNYPGFILTRNHNRMLRTLQWKSSKQSMALHTLRKLAWPHHYCANVCQTRRS